MRVHRTNPSKKEKAKERQIPQPATPAPHNYITVCGVKITQTPQSIYTPCLNSCNREWPIEAVPKIIENFARIAIHHDRRWIRYQQELLKEPRLITRAWRQQQGRCCITGIPLLGGPGLIAHGIGIDLANPQQGITKGNIRLVSCPIAVSNLITGGSCSGSYPAYDKFGMSCMLARALMPRFKDSRIARRVPLKIETVSHTRLLTVQMLLRKPDKPTASGYLNTVRADSTVFTLDIKDDSLVYKVWENSGHKHYSPFGDYEHAAEKWQRLLLSDPVDTLSIVAKAFEDSILCLLRSSLYAWTASTVDFYNP